MGDAAIALVTKIRVIQIAVDRLDADISDLSAEITASAESVDKCIAQKKALVLKNEAIGFRIVASLDAFLYEARSTYEMLRTFVINYSRHILKRRCSERGAEEILRQAMLAKRHGSEWVEDLRRDRAMFFHETAPWIAMEITSREPRRYGLIVLKDIVPDLEVTRNYVKLEEYQRIWLGLQTCFIDMQSWALTELDQIDPPQS
ncbi:MAG: hypothetical protein ACLQBA_24850 [Candidatus Binataceae bacterium]